MFNLYNYNPTCDKKLSRNISLKGNHDIFCDNCIKRLRGINFVDIMVMSHKKIKIRYQLCMRCFKEFKPFFEKKGKYKAYINYYNKEWEYPKSLLDSLLQDLSPVQRKVEHVFIDELLPIPYVYTTY